MIPVSVPIDGTVMPSLGQSATMWHSGVLIVGKMILSQVVSCDVGVASGRASASPQVWRQLLTRISGNSFGAEER